MNSKKIKEVIRTMDINKAIHISNEYALATTEELVTESLVLADKWQNLTQKAIHGGFKLAANQQDLMFQTLDAVKGQYTLAKKRVNKLFV